MPEEEQTQTQPSAEDLETDEFDAVWNYDPFAKPDEGQQEPQQQQQAAPETPPQEAPQQGQPPTPDQQAAPQPPAQPAAPQATEQPTPPAPSVAPQVPEQPVPAPGAPGVPQPPTAPAAPAAPKPPDRIELLEAQVKAQTQLIERLMAQGQAGAPGQQPAAPQESEIQVPDYAFEIPPQLVEALAAEEPATRQVALQQLVKGTAQGVHRTLMQEVNKVVSDTVQRQVQSAVSSQRSGDAIANDFYSAYPQFNREEIKPIVHRAGQQILAEMGPGVDWSPQLRDAIAYRTQQLILSVAGMIQPQQPQAPAAAPQQVPGAGPVAPQPSGRPPVQFGGNTSAGVAGGNSVADQVSELLGL